MTVDRRISLGVNPRPLRRLTEAGVETFFAEGYLTRLPVFDNRGVRKNLDGLEELQQLLGGRPLVETTYCQERCHPYQYFIASDPVILDYVEDILGPNFFLWCSHVVCKEPHEKRPYTWHQDVAVAPIAFHEGHSVHADLPVSVTVWVAIDDADAENGALQVIPRSHLRGVVPHIDIVAHYADDPAPGIPPHLLDETQAVTLALKAGEACIFHDRLFHGSGPNLSDRRRAGMALHYSRTEAQVDRTVWPNMKVRCVRGTDRFGFQPTWEHFEPGPIDVFAADDAV
jgi:ectoine hydroxylase-related dioxygenase (phytanoyl-CoA dioxygenase family)